MLNYALAKLLALVSTIFKAVYNPTLCTEFGKEENEGCKDLLESLAAIKVLSAYAFSYKLCKLPNEPRRLQDYLEVGSGK